MHLAEVRQRKASNRVHVLEVQKLGQEEDESGFRKASSTTGTSKGALDVSRGRCQHRTHETCFVPTSIFLFAFACYMDITVGISLSIMMLSTVCYNLYTNTIHVPLYMGTRRYRLPLPSHRRECNAPSPLPPMRGNASNQALPLTPNTSISSRSRVLSCVASKVGLRVQRGRVIHAFEGASKTHLSARRRAHQRSIVHAIEGAL